MRPATKTALFSLATVAVVVAVSEIALRLAAALFAPPLAPMVPIALEDARLGKRPNPAYPGHDRNGFRNPDVPAHASIVAMGDSQTYGMGVPASNAWPQVLASLSQMSTYNLAFGGFGPGHRLLLLDDAIALHPRLIIEAFYAGNDLYDSYAIVYQQHQLPELRSTDPAVQQAIAEAERSDPIEAKTTRLFRACMAAPAPPPPAGVDALLRQHVRLYGLMAQLWDLALHRSTSAAQPAEDYWDTVTRGARAAPKECAVLETDTVHTVLTAPYRFCGLDLTDPRIAEGERIAFAAIKAMHQRATAAHIRFLVLLLPTKELVFKDIAEQNGPPADFRELVQNEERMTRDLEAFLARDGIDYVEALPDLRTTLAAGVQPYPISWDGHPNLVGQHAIAGAVLNAIIARHLTSDADKAPAG